MKLPRFKYSSYQYKSEMMEFKGLNLGNVVADGEFSDSLNISCDEFPCIAPRLPRKVIKTGLTAPTNIYSKDGKLAYIDGTGFYYDGEQKGVVVEGEKQITGITTKIIIFPDKCYYDVNTDTFGTLEKTYESGDGQITFAAGSITTTGADFEFNAGDSVEITGCTVNKANNKIVVIKSVSSKTLTFQDNTFTVGKETGAITLKRKVPDMDYICEYNNRIWGCKDSTIWASKQGDPFNWEVYSGVSTDSYYVDVGSEGKFTGVIGFTSHLAFFKENCIHKLFGSKPSNFQMVTSQCAGVQEGCGRSLQVINDIVFYKSQLGIMAYTGNVPELISDKLGNVKYSQAVAGVDDNKYYVSMKHKDGWDMLVYDVRRDMWIKEDDVQVKDFTVHDGKICFLNARDNNIYSCNEVDADESFEWMVTLGETTEFTSKKKGYVRFYLNAELEKDSTLSVYLNYDRKGWVKVHTIKGTNRRNIKIPIIPERCDYLSIKIEGYGKGKVYSLAKEVQIRGDSR